MPIREHPKRSWTATLMRFGLLCMAATIGAGIWIWQRLEELDRQLFLGRFLLEASPAYEDRASFSTGTPTLDHELPWGGWPRGALVEVCGESASGKSLLAQRAVKACLHAGELACVLDLDRHAPQSRVGLGDALWCQPDHAEEALAMIEALLERGEVALIVVDSVDAMVPKDAVEEGWSELQIEDRRGQLLSQSLQKLMGLLVRSQATLVLLRSPRSRASDVLQASSFFSRLSIELTPPSPSSAWKLSQGAALRGQIVRCKGLSEPRSF